MINESRIKQQIRKAIKIKPVHVTIMRLIRGSNGMKGGGNKEDKVIETDVLIDDSKHSTLLATTEIKRTRNITMLIVADDIEIKVDDYFMLDNSKYRITYSQKIVKDVYNCDLEMVK